MIVTLDGDKLNTSFTPGGDLRALVDDVRSGITPERLIVSVSVNGEPLCDAVLADRLAQQLAADDQIDLESADRTKAAADALRAVADNVGELARTSVEIAGQVSSAAPVGGLQRIGDFIRAWQTCNTAITQVSDVLAMDLLSRTHDGETLGQHVDVLLTTLTMIRDALEARDLVSLADALRYEMPSQCETWTALLGSLADSIERGD